MTGPVRLSDVAKAAGVSLGTASNVFNKQQQVRPELRDRVETAARELGYRGPDPAARRLMGGKVHAIGVVTPGVRLTHPFMSVYGREFMAGVAEVCDAMEADLTLVSGLDDRRVRGVRNAIVDGFIIQRVEDVALLESFTRGKPPFVVVDVDAGQHISSVRIDDRGGARAQARHLVGLGHRRFVIGSGCREDDRHPIFHAPGEGDHQLVAGFASDRERLSGWAEVLAEVGISIRDVPIVEVAWGKYLDEGHAMLFDKAPEATAMITGADDGALLLLKEARRRGIVVPRDLSIIGFDDVPAAAQADPPLTTIAQNPFEKGRAAARLLFEGGPPQNVVLPVQLVVRASTAPPRS